MNSNPLGKGTDYPKEFSPDLLFAIPRDQARAEIDLGDKLPFVGYDEWNLYELCWLDSHGSPQVGIGQLVVPADSPNIVESKSLKLYINSLFYKRFESRDQLISQVSADLKECIGSELDFFVNKAHTSRQQDSYISLDRHKVTASQKADIRNVETEINTVNRIYRYETKRFRSLCPVTGQPDWASIYIRIDGLALHEQTLAQYLAGYAEHEGFHENCVERIYCELQQQLDPDQLSVAARFTRRGGIDINPVRANSMQVLEMPGRGIRQ